MNTRTSQSFTGQWASAIPSRQSLEYRLPLLIGSLLVLVILALSTAAYVEVRRSATRVASDRLASVTRQFSDLFKQSSVQLRGQALATARKADVQQFALKRAPKEAVKAREQLRYAGPTPEQVLGVELRDSAGALLLSTAPGDHAIAALDATDSPPPKDSAAVGRYRVRGDTTMYPIVARVPGTSALVVQWRRVANSRRTREQLTRLIGLNASILIGNTDGTYWTNLERPIPPPAIREDTAHIVKTYTRADGARALIATQHIAGTPWSFAMDFPKRDIMAPVDRFLSEMAIIAGIALLLGLGVAWAMSHRITAPIIDLTSAAATLAAGGESPQVHVDRRDEIGRLGLAFNTMAREVAQAREGLERKVEERTSELSDTMHKLRDAQDSLVRREKLAMLGQLSSGVGHELRNPLGVMTNAIYFLKMVLKDAPPTVREYLDILQQQITLSEKIVSDLLDFARQKPPNRKPASLGDVTSAQVARLGSTNGVRIETHLDASVPKVLVDEVQIGQIVLNLLTNAMQAMNGNGRIVVRARRENGHVDYEVTDTGPGIAPENLDKIFEPLFTTKARGIGLGLAVSRTLARANDGDLSVTSELGKGATFRLTLPVAEASV